MVSKLPKQSSSVTYWLGLTHNEQCQDPALVKTWLIGLVMSTILEGTWCQPECVLRKIFVLENWFDRVSFIGKINPYCFGSP